MGALHYAVCNRQLLGGYRRTVYVRKLMVPQEELFLPFGEIS